MEPCTTINLWGVEIGDLALAVIRNFLLGGIITTMVTACIFVGRLIQIVKDLRTGLQEGTIQNHADHQRIIDSQTEQGQRIARVESKVETLCG